MSTGFNSFVAAVHWPAVNNDVQSLLQVMVSRTIFEARKLEENSSYRRGVLPTMNGMPNEHPSLASSGPAAPHDEAGLSITTGGRNGVLASTCNLVGQPSASSGDAQDVYTVDVNLTLSIPSSREQPPIPKSSGFGSPLFRAARTMPEHITEPPQPPQSGQGVGLQIGTVARYTAQSHLPGSPSTAQLTIFYSGMVNVYDDVPADKAQAIMLLAGSGGSWSTSSYNPTATVPVRVAPSITAGMPTPFTAPSHLSPAVVALARSRVGTSDFLRSGGISKPTITLHAELPQARKASLARFLEKRKDRARGGAPYVTAAPCLKKVTGDGPSPAKREKSPSPGVAVRSPSPGITAPLKRSQSPVSRAVPSCAAKSELSRASGVAEITSQTRLPVPGIQHLSPTSYSGEKAAALGVFQKLSKEVHHDWTSRKVEPTEKEVGSPLWGQT